MITLAEQLEQNGVIVHTNKGVSMMPLLRENRDLIVVRRKEPGRLHKYDVVLFQRANGEYVLHRILKMNQNSYWIVGDNCAFGEMVTDEQILGILTEIVRDGKTIEVTDKKYLCFVYIWTALFPVRSFRIRFIGRLTAVVHKLTGR